MEGVGWRGGVEGWGGEVRVVGWGGGGSQACLDVSRTYGRYVNDERVVCMGFEEEHQVVGTDTSVLEEHEGSAHIEAIEYHSGGDGG